MKRRQKYSLKDYIIGFLLFIVIVVVVIGVTKVCIKILPYPISDIVSGVIIVVVGYALIVTFGKEDSD